MVRELTKVVYKPSPEATEDFIVIVNPAEYKRWKNGETSIPLAEVVDCECPFVHQVVWPPPPAVHAPERGSQSVLTPGHDRSAFQVFWSNQGAQGLLGTPSNQQLDNVFGTHKDVDVITQILQKGKEESGKGIRTGEGVANLAKGSFAVDTKGKSSTSGIP
ncbi:DUF1960-domain-containing protein [Cubamyces sp. BRFM 1775]|nr:DUF1960-domain-containing protein [Cubamyces sp. BRFM 1775]